MYNSNIHHRRSIRLKGYDYSQEGLYFITLCTTDRVHLFGEIENGEMQLNTYGEIAKQEWLKTIEIRKNIELLEYIIMPNHIHGIIEIKYSLSNENKKELGKFKSPSQTIGAIIRGYKGATTKRIKEIIKKDNISTGELQFAPTAPTAPTAPPNPTAPNTQLLSRIDLSKSIWQRNYYENIIRDEKALNNISNYIFNNPKKWEEDKFYKSISN